MSVFVYHIAGTKKWHLYEGRMPNAAQLPGVVAADFPQEHHEKVKGQVLEEVMMTPGDLLYIPHGQYHDAIATGGESLHISVSVRHLVAQDFLNLLAQDLPKDPVFREHLPHIDSFGNDGPYRQRLADRLQQIITSPQISQQLRAFLHGKAYERTTEFDLPERGPAGTFRVRWMGSGLMRQGGVAHIVCGNSQTELNEQEADIADWALDRDFFSSLELGERLGSKDPKIIGPVLQKFSQAGLIERM